MKTVLILTALSIVLTGATAVGATGIVMCKGSQLSGSFAAVPGSAGAGNISYLLRLKNGSKTSCSVTGLPRGGCWAVMAGCSRRTSVSHFPVR